MLREAKKTAPVLNSKEDKCVSENEKNMNENEKDLIGNGQAPEDLAPEEGAESGELTEEELQEFERKEKRDNEIMTFLHLS